MSAARDSLGRDKLVRGIVLLLALSAVPLVTPILSDAGRANYGEHVLGAPFLLALVVALGLRARSATHSVERRFWTLLTIAFLWWLVAMVITIIADATVESMATLRLVTNSSYLLFYAVIAAALEVHPQVTVDPWTARLQAADRVASFVFLLGLLIYFLGLPGLMREGAVWVSALALFAAIDVYLVLRLASLRRATQDAEWRATYSWLLAGATVWGLADAATMLMNQGSLPNLPYGTLFDVTWAVAFVMVFIATRAGAYESGARPFEEPAPVPPPVGPAAAYAVLFPLLHLVYYRFASSDPELRPARDVLVLAFTVALAAVAFAYHGLVRLEHRRLTHEEGRIRGQLTYLAFHDELTGLPNRDMFKDHLRLAMADARRYRRRCAVLFCDLDRFKVINDSLGHEAGDEVLISVAQRLRASVRELDTVARFGGDEFTIILHGISRPLDAARLAEKMLATLGEPVEVQGKEHVLTASLGIAVCPDDGEDESTLLKHADTAMYEAKLQGRNTYRLFTRAMNDAAEERLAVEQGLRTTDMEGSFVVFYQPIVSVATGEPIAHEALLRWNHPERGLVPPESFIEVAEQTGLIVPIGQWVLETACTWARKMDAESAEPLSMAVNISAKELQEPTFVKDVMTILERAGLAPSRLHLEVTESIALDTEAAVPVLTELRARGISIVVDDFGTGLAALSRLRDCPVDVVKIDGSFVRAIDDDPVGATIVRAIVMMAKALDFYVVAEGVETEAEFEVLKGLKCDAVQGFYLRSPMPPADIEVTLADRRRFAG